MESRNVENTPQKRQRRSDHGGVSPVDRISNLPESIISHILSFLPTKSAVATSFLSKSWRFRWTEVISFDFNDWDWVDGKNPPAIPFVEFVNRVLGKQKNAEFSMDKFRLKWKPESRSTCIGKWVSTAIARHVRFLELDIQHYSEKFQFQFHLPAALYTCCSLEVLKLSGSELIVDPDVVCLPKLVVLELINAADESYDSLPKLLSGCPVLQSLRIVADYERMKVFTISSPTLKRLQINFIVFLPLGYWKLKIDTPELEYLVLDDDACWNISGLALIEGANLDKIGELVDGDGNHELVQAFYGLKFMKLSVLTSIAVRNATKKLSASFESLTKLVIEIECWCYLMDMINFCVKLQVLDVTKFGDFCGYYNDHVGSRRTCSCWEDPVRSAPRCLSSSLTRLSYMGFEGLKNEMKMLEYILKHGSVMETVDLCSIAYATDFSDKPIGSRKRSQIIKKISYFSRAAPACEVSLS